MTGKRFFTHAGSPLVIILGFLIGLLSISDSPLGIANGYSAIVSTWAVSFGLAPALALASAWEMSRFKDILLAHGKQSGVWKVLRRRVGPLMTLAFVLSLIALVIFGGATNSQTLRGIVLIALPILLWSLFGSACGLWLPTLIAVAIAGIIPIVVTLYPPAFTDMRWRQMFGQTFGGCCSTHQQLDPILLNASMLTLSALTVTTLAVVAARITSKQRMLVAAGAAVLITAGGIVAGYSMSAGGNADSSVARDLAEMRCDDVACVWPETDPQTVTENRDALARLARQELRLVDLPRTRDDYGNATIRTLGDNEIALVHSSDPSEVELNLVQQILAKDPKLVSTPSCWSDDNGNAVPVSEALFGLPATVIKPAALHADGTVRSNESGPEGIDRDAIIQATMEECGL